MQKNMVKNSLMEQMITLLILIKNIYTNKTRPENLDFLAKLRKLTNKYDAMLLGEVGSDDSLQTIEDYTKDKIHLHTGYGFQLLINDCSAEYIGKVLSNHEKVMDNNGWICCSTENHDVPRIITRWLGDNCPDQYKNQLSKTLNTFLFLIRGSVCVYQGQELGLFDSKVAFEDLQDPFSISLYPNLGRDGCRVPMPWDSTKTNLGFNDGKKTWLPVEQGYKNLCVNMQQQDNESVLNHFKKLVDFYKKTPELIDSKTSVIDLNDSSLIAFARKSATSTFYCIFNLSNQVKKGCNR